MKRRNFLRNTVLAGASLANLEGVARMSEIFSFKNENELPPWRGFNLRDFNTPYPGSSRFATTEEHFKWMQDWGFDFIRLPVAYPYYLKFDRTKNITPEGVYQIDESVVNRMEQLVFLAHKYQLHVSLNLHRAPGYCINAGFHEPYNLWKDKAAQDAYYFHWNFWAKRFKNISSKKISFDLHNEPVVREDMNDQHSGSTPVPPALYYDLVDGACKAIREENKDHLIIADGNNVGNDPTPELKDLKVGQSCRGYFPHGISHYKAPWASSRPDEMPVPVYPGKTGNRTFDRETLEKYYQPWIDLKNSGVGVHCGECGSWNKTPHEVFLAWFTDVTDILSSHQIGFALWEFIGDFGILNSGRADVDYLNWHGYKLDKKLLELIRKK